MIVDADDPSPLMQQYIWESNDAGEQAKGIALGERHCSRCGSRLNWAWCPNCHPMHTQELP